MPNKDPEKRKAYNAAYRAERLEELNARERARYSEPGYKERQQANRKANLARYAEYQRNRRRRLPEEHLFLQAKSRAKKFGIPFTITQADIEWVTHCPVFGMELNYRKNEGSKEGWSIRQHSATLDRRDNAKGYVPGNVFVISHHANRLKGDATIEQLEAILRYARALTVP